MKTEPESKVSDEALLRLACAAASPHEVYECQTTFNDGCLGSRNDEERSEMRYVM